MSYSAVIDSSSLVYLSQLHKKSLSFDSLQQIFHTIYFPLEVTKEFGSGTGSGPQRTRILERLKTEHGYYRFCTTYDSIVLAMIENYKGIDKGEAEVYAQFKKINAQIIISDDKRFIAAIKQLDKSIQVYTTIHLLCWLEHAGFINEWEDAVRQLHSIRPFKSAELRDAFLLSAKRFSINVPKKIIDRKCSVGRLIGKRQKIVDFTSGSSRPLC